MVLSGPHTHFVIWCHHPGAFKVLLGFLLLPIILKNLDFGVCVVAGLLNVSRAFYNRCWCFTCHGFSLAVGGIICSSCSVDWALCLLLDFSTFALFSLLYVFLQSLWVCCGLPRSVCCVCVTSSVLYQEDPLSSERKVMESSENVSDRTSAVRRGIIIQNRKWSAIHQNTQSIGLLLSSLQGFTGRSYGAESGREGGVVLLLPESLCDCVWSLPPIYYITTAIIHLGANSCVNTSDHPP